MSDHESPRVITITSGKGGVGKTNITVNLALQLAAQGHHPCLFDADLGLANINILLGLHPEFTLEDVILGGRDLQDIIIKDFQGIDIIPGSSGVEKIANLEESQLDHLIHVFDSLSGYDFLFFDTSAGISKDVLAFCLASSEVVMVITPEPTSLTDGYALLKVLKLNNFAGRVFIVVNQCPNVQVAKTTYAQFRETAKRYLQADVVPLGVVLKDNQVVESVKAQKPVISLYPNSNASKCIKHIAKNLLDLHQKDVPAITPTSFWRKCVGIFKGPLTLTEEAQPEEGKSGDLISDGETPDTTSADAEAAASPQEKDVSSEPPVHGDEDGKDDQGASLPAQSEGAPSREPQKHQDKAMAQLMRELIASVSSVSDEVKHLRAAIHSGSAIEVPQGSGLGVGPALAEKKVVLDFEAFLHERQQREDRVDE